MNDYKAIMKSLIEVFIGACIAQATAGETNPKVLFNSGVGAVLVVLGRYFNPKDTAFGSKGK